MEYRAAGQMHTERIRGMSNAFECAFCCGAALAVYVIDVIIFLHSYQDASCVIA